MRMQRGAIAHRDNVSRPGDPRGGPKAALWNYRIAAAGPPAALTAGAVGRCLVCAAVTACLDLAEVVARVQLELDDRRAMLAAGDGVDVGPAHAPAELTASCVRLANLFVVEVSVARNRIGLIRAVVKVAEVGALLGKAERLGDLLHLLADVWEEVRVGGEVLGVCDKDTGMGESRRRAGYYCVSASDAQPPEHG